MMPFRFGAGSAIFTFSLVRNRSQIREPAIPILAGFYVRPFWAQRLLHLQPHPRFRRKSFPPQPTEPHWSQFHD